MPINRAEIILDRSETSQARRPHARSQECVGPVPIKMPSERSTLPRIPSLHLPLQHPKSNKGDSYEKPYVVRGLAICLSCIRCRSTECPAQFLVEQLSDRSAAQHREGMSGRRRRKFHPRQPIGHNLSIGGRCRSIEQTRWYGSKRHRDERVGQRHFYRSVRLYRTVNLKSNCGHSAHDPGEARQKDRGYLREVKRKPTNQAAA